MNLISEIKAWLTIRPSGLQWLRTTLKNSAADPIYTHPDKISEDTMHRARTSEPLTLFEFENKYDFDNNLYFDTQLVGSATNTHNPDAVSRNLNVTTAINDEVIYQSRRCIEYIKGKSQLIFLTANFNGTQDGLRTRLGHFDESNGFFFENLNNELRICRRSSASGSLVETVVSQADWNLDNLDGSGDIDTNPSGIQADLTKQFLFFLEFSWLGSGSIRWGIEAENKKVYIHEESYSGELALPFSQSGQLPVRAEIKAITGLVSPHTLNVTCGSVISEGGTVDTGRVRGFRDKLIPSSYSNTEQFIHALRINPAYNYSSAKFLTKSFFASSGTKDVYYKLLFNPSIVGGTWNDIPNSCMQYLSAPTSYAGGNIIDDGHFPLSSKLAEPSPFRLASDIFLGRAIDGTPDVLLLAAEAIGGNGDAYTGFTWREYV